MNSSKGEPERHYEKLREKILQKQPVDIERFLQHGLLEWVVFDGKTESIPLPSLRGAAPNFCSGATPRTEIVSILTAIMFHHQKGEKYNDNNHSL